MSFTEMDEDFFEISSQQEKNWNPSNGFFGNEPKQFIKNFDPSSKEEDNQLVIHLGNTADKTTGIYPDFIDVIEHVASASKINGKSSKQIIHNSKEALQYKAYFTRFINIFLRNTGLGDTNMEDDGKTVTVDMRLSKRDLAVLKNFGSDDDISLEALENSFTSVFNSVNKENTTKGTSEIMPFLKYSILFLSLVMSVVYTLYLIIKFHLNKVLLILAICIAYISVVSFDLMQQYEDISEQMIIKRIEFENLSAPPKECFPSHMSYSEKIYFHLFGGKETCEQFLISRKSAWSQMDLASAFSKPIYVVFMKLCSVLGEGAEKLIKPMTDKCPWPFNGALYFLLSLLQLPLLIFSVCIIISTLSSGSISLKILPFFSITSERLKIVEKYSLPSKQSKEALEGIRPNAGTHINNQGGIILFANNDSGMDSRISRKTFEDLSLCLKADPGNHFTQLSSYFQNTETVNANKESGNIYDFNSKYQCNEMVMPAKGPNVSSKMGTNFFKNTDNTSENKTSVSLFSSQTDNVKPDSMFSKQRTVMEEKVKRTKNKSFKKVPKMSSKWKSITDENVKELFKLRVKK